MAALTLRLLGPGVLMDGATVVRTHSGRALALLAYLALESGRPHPRSTLVDLLWNDQPPASGRQSLRQALYSLRTVAGGRLADVLQVDPRWIRFDLPASGSPVDIDVHRLVEAARSASETDWRDAAALPQAPLLEGLAAVPGNDFETWLLGWRDRLRALAMQNLGRLVVAHMARGEWDAAANMAQAMCTLDPASEVPSQYLLKIYAMQGRTQAVDAEWARLCTRLSQSLGVEPSAETLGLHRAMRRRGADRPAPGASGPGHAAGELPDPFVPGATDESEAMVRAGQAAERVFSLSQAADLYDRALQSMRRDLRASSQRCFDVLLLREAMLERLGRRGEQASVIDEATSIANQLGDLPRMAAAQLRRAGVCTYLRRHHEAAVAAEQALQIFRALDDTPGQAEALRELGFVHWHAEDHLEALNRTREALELHRRIGDVTGEATALHNLAEIHRGLGSPRQASQWFEQAMQLHWAARNPVGEILSLFGWASALRQTGELSVSREKLEAALKLSERHGERIMHSRALQALAMHHASQGALDAALDGMRRAIEVDRAIGYAHALGHDLVAIADLHRQRGELAEARVALQEALVWYGFTQDDDALAATRERLRAFDSRLEAWPPPVALRAGVKSHLALGEGKVYCEFESPVRVRPD